LFTTSRSNSPEFSSPRRGLCSYLRLL